MVPKICAANDCETEAAKRGYCNPHYKRFRKWGDPNVIHTNRTAEDRFWPKVDKSGECWEWTAARNGGGYGLFGSPKGYSSLAHRFAYQTLIGPIPDGMTLDHLCRNRGCVNPAHLEPVSSDENKRRGLTHRLLNGMDFNCINGHAYTPENTYVNPNKNNDVRCRTCAYEIQVARKAA